MTNTVTELQVIPQGNNNDKRKSNNTFRVYHYFKAHPSFFIAVLSAFIALLSIAFNFAAFLNVNSYLQYFQVDNVFFEPSTQSVYSVAVASFFSFVFVLMQGFFTKTFKAYLPYKKILLLHKFSLKKIRKRMKTSKKTRISIEKSLRSSSHLSSKSDTRDGTLADIALLKKQEEEIKEEYDAIRKEVKKSRILFFSLLFFSCILMWLILYLSLTFIISFSSHKQNNVISSSILYSIIFVFAFATMNWFFECFFQIDKKAIKADAEKQIEHTKYFADNNFKPFPITVFFTAKPKELFSDSNCKKILITIIVGLLALLLMMSSHGLNTASDQNEFFIIKIDNQAYALIYNNGKSAVLERVDFSDGSINIDTTDQKIVPSNNISMKKLTFENANIIREEDIYSRQEKTNFANNIYQKAKSSIKHLITCMEPPTATNTES